jgi:hypothetical protein
MNVLASTSSNLPDPSVQFSAEAEDSLIEFRAAE